MPLKQPVAQLSLDQELHRCLARYKQVLQLPNQTALRDLLTDLRHWADLHSKVNFELAIRGSYFVYCEEKRDAAQQQQQPVQQQQGPPVRRTCHARKTGACTLCGGNSKKRNS